MEELTVRVGTDTMGFERGLARVGKTVAGLSMQVAKWGSAATAAGAVATMWIGMKFERALMETATVANAFGNDLKDLEKKARELGKTTAFTATDAAKAMYDLASAGLTTTEVLQATTDSMKFAGATNSTMAQATQIVAATIKQFNMEATESKRIVDTFASAITDSLLTMESLTEAMKYAGTTGASLSWSLEQTVAAVAQFSDLGLEGSMSGTNLRMSMLSLMNQTDKSREALRRMNLTFKDINPEAHDFGEILLTLGKAGISSLDAIDLFSSRSAMNMKQLSNLAVQGTTDFKAMIQSYVTGQQGIGRAAEMYNRMMDTTWGKFKIVLSNIQDLALTVFDLFKEQLGSAFDYISEKFIKLSEVIEENKSGLKEFFNILKVGLEETATVAAESAGVVVKFFAAWGELRKKARVYEQAHMEGTTVFHINMVEKLIAADEEYFDAYWDQQKQVIELDKKAAKDKKQIKEANRMNLSALEDILSIEQEIYKLETIAGKKGIDALNAKHKLEREAVDDLIKKARDASAEGIAQANPKASLQETSKMLVELDKRMALLSSKYKGALSKQQALEISDFVKQESEKNKNSIEEEQRKIDAFKNIEREYSSYMATVGLSGLALIQEQNRQEIEATKLKYERLIIEYANHKEELERMRDAEIGAKTKVGGVKEQEFIKGAKAPIEEQLKQYNEYIRTYGLEGSELQRVQGQIDIENLKEVYDEKIAKAREYMDVKAAEAAVVDEIAKRSSENQITYEKAVADAKKQMLMDTLNSTVEGFRTIAEAGGKYSKQAFAMYKATAITQALINTYTAATGIFKNIASTAFLGPLALPLAYAGAAAAIAAGMGQVAMIKGQEMPSYDQGGISTKPGVYYSGIPEAHIPLKDGKVPVEIAINTRKQNEYKRDNKENNNVINFNQVKELINNSKSTYDKKTIISDKENNNVINFNQVKELINTTKLISYDKGGINTTPQIYSTNVPEAHIPLKDGKVPVTIGGKYNNAGSKVVNINYVMENPTFTDQDTLIRTQAAIASAIATRIVKEIGSNVIVNDYNSDKPIRKVLRGGR